MTERWIVAALVVVGFGFTATNGVVAYRSAKDRLTRYGRRVRDIRSRSTHDGTPTAVTVDDSAADDAVERVLHALQASRTSLVLAGVGLLISTVAAVWALFV